MSPIQTIFLAVGTLLLPMPALASGAEHAYLNLTHQTVGYLALVIFVAAYVLVILEEKLLLRKSKPVLLAAGIIWAMIGFAYAAQGVTETTAAILRDNFLEYSELFFFLLVAMTYINAMIERDVFQSLHFWLVSKGLSYRRMFWLTGILTFFISSVADNLTSALIMCTVAMTIGAQQPKFVTLACVSIVIAANAGGAFSPFGDITTLMVWQNGVIEFTGFFKLFIPAVINYCVPAAIMHFFIPQGIPDRIENGHTKMKQSGGIVVLLFLLTIATSITFHQALHLPPVLGMLTGLGYLNFLGYYLRIQHRQEFVGIGAIPGTEGQGSGFDIFSQIAKAEWDTLLFFYGVMMCVGGLGFIGYLSILSEFIYGELGATAANIIIGVMSAVVDNIPIMFAVLTMNPDMPENQWLLVTLTAGVGGSLLSIGSAAGVALMGQAHGDYTFFKHLRWTPVIGLGYVASIMVHMWIN
ncbi:MAG: sodium:proton antiporter NhaD [Methylomonas sp.]|nr:sodium:proton antiporter NhaD [Methylomonas sp.]